MKKLIVIVVLAAAAYAAYALLLRPSEKRACGRMAALCGLDLRDGGDQCASALEAMRKTNPAAAEKATICLADAKSCGEAAGCASGMALSVGAGFVGDFLHGVTKTLTQEPAGL